MAADSKITYFSQIQKSFFDCTEYHSYRNKKRLTVIKQ